MNVGTSSYSSVCTSAQTATAAAAAACATTSSTTTTHTATSVQTTTPQNRFDDATPLYERFTQLTITAQNTQETAKQVFQRALKQNPSETAAHINLGLSYAKEKNNPYLALYHFQQAKKCKSTSSIVTKYLQDASLNFEAGQYLLKTSNEAEAFLFFQKVVEIDPEHVQAHYLLGRMLYKCSGIKKNCPQALEHFQKVVELDENYASAHAYIGTILFLDETPNLKNLAEAERHLQKALVLEPKNAYALAKMGGVQKANGRHDEAKAYFNQALQYNSNESYALSRMGGYFLKEEQIILAKEYLEKSLKLEPNNPYALGKYGEFLYRHEKNYEEALNYFKKGHESNPEDPYFLTKQGKVHELLHNTDLALESYNKALQIKPSDREARAGVDRLTPFVSMLYTMPLSINWPA